MDEVSTIIAAALFAIGLIMGAVAVRSAFRQEAIDKGYAQYCSATGYWAWKGECSE